MLLARVATDVQNAGRMSEFGIYILCHKADFRLTRGCCESIRTFAPKMPICLIVDGTFSTRALERQYGCQIIRREDVRDASLRKESFGGWGYSKMVAFWEGPFDRFLYLDADIVVAGDLGKLAAESDADVIFAGTGGLMNDLKEIDLRWMNPNFVRAHCPGYRVEGRPYFITCSYFGRKGLFDLDEYLRVLRLTRANPQQSFRAGEQGMLNYLTFAAADAGRLRYEARDFLRGPLYMTEEELRTLNAKLANPDAGWAGDPAVLHYFDVKPSVLHDGVFHRLRRKEGVWGPAAGWATAMNRFRMRSWRAAGLPGPVALARVTVEDLLFHSETFRGRIRAKLLGRKG